MPESFRREEHDPGLHEANRRAHRVARACREEREALEDLMSTTTHGSSKRAQERFGRAGEELDRALEDYAIVMEPGESHYPEDFPA